MNRLLLMATVFSLFVTRINTHAQDTIKLIEEEIRNAKESPVVIILNARQLLLSKIKEDEIDKVSEILSYLNSSIDTLTYAAFYPMEKVMIDILIYRFFYIKNIEILYSMMIRRESRKIYPHEDGFYAELNKLLEKHKDKIDEKSKSKDLSEVERAFLGLFIDAIVIDGENRQKILNEKADSFLAEYPGSKFDNFVRNYIRYVYKPSKFGLGFAFFSGRTLLTRGLKEKFSPHSPLGVMFDIYYRNFVLFLIDHIGIPSDTKKDFYVGDDTWKKGTAVNMFLPSLEFGYQFNILDRLFISPFIGISSQCFSSCKVERDKGNDISTPWTAAFTAGLNTDIAFLVRKGRTNFAMVSMNEASYWTIRIRAGYSDARFESKYAEDFSGGVIFFQIGIGGFGRPIKRDL